METVRLSELAKEEVEMQQMEEAARIEQLRLEEEEQMEEAIRIEELRFEEEEAKALAESRRL